MKNKVGGKPFFDFKLFLVILAAFLLARGIDFLVEKKLSEAQMTIADIVSECDRTPAESPFLFQWSNKIQMGEDPQAVLRDDVYSWVLVEKIEYLEGAFPEDSVAVAAYYGPGQNHPSIYHFYSLSAAREWVTIYPDHYQRSPVQACGTYLLGN